MKDITWAVRHLQGVEIRVAGRRDTIRHRMFFRSKEALRVLGPRLAKHVRVNIRLRPQCRGRYGDHVSQCQCRAVWVWPTGLFESAKVDLRVRGKHGGSALIRC